MTAHIKFISRCIILLIKTFVTNKTSNDVVDGMALFLKEKIDGEPYIRYLKFLFRKELS